ncbi:hypothetical protein ACLOJK_024496 [Asimina triloba]
MISTRPLRRRTISLQKWHVYGISVTTVLEVDQLPQEAIQLSGQWRNFVEGEGLFRGAIAVCQRRNFNPCSSNFGFSKHRFVSFGSISRHRLGKDRGSDSGNPSFSVSDFIGITVFCSYSSGNVSVLVAVIAQSRDWALSRSAAYLALIVGGASLSSLCFNRHYRNKKEFQFCTKQLRFEMSSLSISVGTSGSHAGRASVSRSLICPGRGFLAVDLCRNSFRLSDGVWLKGLEQPTGRSVHKFRVFAKLRKGKGLRKIDPWYKDIDPNLKTGHLTYLSDFKPLKQKPKPLVLEFEKRYINLEKKLNYGGRESQVDKMVLNVRKLANDMGLDFSDQISFLEEKYQEWVELHGDRAGYDDPAIVAGLGSIDGKTYMFIGQQKGRDTKENIKRNFAMPTPHGYRKAKRLMQYADLHGFPIVTFVDTAGAFADIRSEELGQGEAIANNLRTMFGLKVPIISIVIGEGGSGGALAIACANKLFMLENAVFYVARTSRVRRLRDNADY